MTKFILVIFLALLFGCQSGNKKQSNGEGQENRTAATVEKTINIGGMHCDMCVASIEKGINQLEGIETVTASLSDSTAVVVFDESKSSLGQIEAAIESRGYKVKAVSE
jgi:copper chaperone